LARKDKSLKGKNASGSRGPFQSQREELFQQRGSQTTVEMRTARRSGTVEKVPKTRKRGRNELRY